MPPFLSPPPQILDQSFPRSAQELTRILVALGNFHQLYENNEIEILTTKVLGEFVEGFDWSKVENYPLLVEIARYCSELFLRLSRAKVNDRLNSVTNHSPHPLPLPCNNEGLAEVWADELGRLFQLHESLRLPAGNFCIGIGCSFALAGEPLGSYPPNANEAFPLVGADSIQSLVDAYEWDVPHDIENKNVSFSDARRNCLALGADRIDNPSGSSHYIVRFPGARSWPLDINTGDPIPERFLKELIPITGYPLSVIKHILLTGNRPQSKCRIL